MIWKLEIKNQIKFICNYKKTDDFSLILVVFNFHTTASKYFIILSFALSDALKMFVLGMKTTQKRLDWPPQAAQAEVRTHPFSKQDGKARNSRTNSKEVSFFENI